MRSVCIVPIKAGSERVKNKNFRLLNGVKLYKNFLNKLKCCDFDEVYIDTDSKEINEFVKDVGYKHIPRLPDLTEPTKNGNHLLTL